MARSATTCWATSGTRASGNSGRRPFAMALAAEPSCTSGRATSRETIQASTPAPSTAANPASATALCTAPSCASTAARVVESRTIASPGGPPRSATYMRRSLVDALSRLPRPSPLASACCTSGRMRWFSS